MKIRELILLFFALFVSIPVGRAVEAERADTATLAGVTITAIKLSPLFREPTASYSADSATLSARRILNVRGVSDMVPNFYVPDYGSRTTSSIYVRGLGARMDQPVIGLNVDNLPVMSKEAYDFDIDDMVSLQLLRGPQSALYGRNTMGGVMSVQTLSPFDYQGVRASAQYGSYNTWHASAGYYWHKSTSPLALSLTAGLGGSDGSFTNEFTGRKCDWEHDYQARFKAEWRPTSSFSLMNVLSASRLSQGGYPYEFIETGKIAYGDTCAYKRWFVADALTLRWELSRFSISSITSGQYEDDKLQLDQDFLPQDYFTLCQSRRQNSVTQDIVMRSRPGQYTWLFGAFAFYKHLDMTAPVTFKDYGIERLIEDHRNEANPHYPIRWSERQFPLDSHFSYPTVGAALYHRSSLQLGSWTLAASLRLDYEHAALRYNNSLHTQYEIYDNTTGQMLPYRTVDMDIDERGRLKHNFFQLLPQLSVLYALPLTAAKANLYASFSKGYKAGGFNTQMFSDVLQQRLMSIMGIGQTYDVDKIVSYKPEKSWNYEVGAHLELPQHALSADVALFYIDCTDQQLTVFPSGMTTGRIMANAGKTRSYGAELTLNYSPLRALNLQASYGYTNARFRRYDDGIHNYKGKFVPYAPQNTLFLSAAYTFSLPWHIADALTIQADMHGTGKIYWDEANALSQPFYAQLGASVTLHGRHYELQFWGRNLTDTHYSTFYFMSISHQFLQRGHPRSLGVTLRINI